MQQDKRGNLSISFGLMSDILNTQLKFKWPIRLQQFSGTILPYGHIQRKRGMLLLLRLSYW